MSLAMAGSLIGCFISLFVYDFSFFIPTIVIVCTLYQGFASGVTINSFVCLAFSWTILILGILPFVGIPFADRKWIYPNIKQGRHFFVTSVPQELWVPSKIPEIQEHIFYCGPAQLTTDQCSLFLLFSNHFAVASKKCKLKLFRFSAIITSDLSYFADLFALLCTEK